MRRYCLAILAGLAVAAAAPIAQAQDYPSRQITLIAPWPAGGAVDALCRAVAPHLSDRLGKSVVVENRPGAGSVIGTAAGAKAAPDGYTIVMAGSGSLAISAALYKKLPYDPVKDLVPLVLAGRIPFFLVVNPSLPVRSVAELVTYAKESPGKLSYASGGPGSPHHLYAELLKSMTGIENDPRSLQRQRPGLDRRGRRARAAVVLRSGPRAAAHPRGQGARARRIHEDPFAVGARHPADRGGRRSRIRRRRLGRVLGAGRHAEGGREQAANRARRRPGNARSSTADRQPRHDPERHLLARGARALHRLRDRALG